MLRVKVAAGELPLVEERLPVEPKVLSLAWNEIPAGELDFEIGQYGGVLGTAHLSPEFDADVGFFFNNEPLLSAPGLGVKDMNGNVVKDFSISEDGKVFTFYMREGLKWSDGYPVTTEDVLFAYEDVLLNEKLTPVFPAWLTAGGEPMKLEIIDKYTFRISFVVPYGGFLPQLAHRWTSWPDTMKPKHYLKQFHTRYTPLEELEPLIKEEALSKGEWWALFSRKDFTTWEPHPDIGFPTLCPWMVVDRPKPGITIFERNPYYFKVDGEGNQLPYIDRLRLEVVTNVEMITMKILAGEVDIRRDGVALDKLPLYKENEEGGNYRVVLLGQHVDPADLFINQTYPDPVWRKIVQDVRFRRALSMGINREEIIDAIYFGFASLPETEYAVYDPMRANQLLDEIGLERDAEGWRLRPDGKRLLIPFESPPWAPDFPRVGELVIDYWEVLGIKTTFKTLDGGLWGARRAANELEASIAHNISFEMLRFNPTVEAQWLSSNWWGHLWYLWDDTDGKEGEEPPVVVKRFLELRDIITTTPSLQVRQETLNQLLRLFAENLFVIPIVAEVPYPLIVAENLGNVQHAGFAVSAVCSGEQLFFRQ